MKKTMKRVALGLLSVAMSLSVCACGGDGGSGDGGSGGKTKISVFNYDGGYGTDWLRNIEAEYEKTHKDVDIDIQPQKPANGYLSADQMKTSNCKVYFMEQVSYSSYIAKDVLSDISDIITSVNPYDGKTIISKFTDQQKDYYKVSDKYYGIPHYAGNNGFTYNKALFDKNSWYFKKERPTNPESVDDYFVSAAGEAKSLGPNGKTGVIDGIDYSWDDGLPATYEDFIILLDYIKSFSIKDLTPITFTGQSREQYIGLLYNALVADYEGDEMLLNYTFDGTATDLGKIENGVFVKDAAPTVISESNGYELARQEGKYRALKFLNDIFSEALYYDQSTAVKGTDSNVDAQTRFIRGKSAIMIEGVWWESESAQAGSAFDQLGQNKKDCNFGWMPLPKADESKIGTETVIDNIYSVCLVKAGLTEKEAEIVKDFIQFVYSDKNLSAFTRDTGTLKALNYKVEDADYNALTEYGKSVYKHKQTVKTIYPLANNAIFRNNQADFLARNYYATDYKVGNDSYKYVSKMLLDDFIGGNKVEANVEKYFSGMYSYYTNKWASYLA